MNRFSATWAGSDHLLVARRHHAGPARRRAAHAQPRHGHLEGKSSAARSWGRWTSPSWAAAISSALAPAFLANTVCAAGSKSRHCGRPRPRRSARCPAWRPSVPPPRTPNRPTCSLSAATRCTARNMLGVAPKAPWMAIEPGLALGTGVGTVYEGTRFMANLPRLGGETCRLRRQFMPDWTHSVRDAFANRP